MKFSTFLIFITIISTLPSLSDSWRDPDWKEMLDSSDVIALIEYKSIGNFRAKAIPLKIYKGELNSDTIWISGFSNRYGPIDTMKFEDRYLVFLKFNAPTKRNVKFWKNVKENKPKFTNYYHAYKLGNAYYVWTPTSGDLKVRYNIIQYNLLETSNYKKQNYYYLCEFENFLDAAINGSSKDFHDNIIKKIRKDILSKKTTQYLMMLYLTSYDKYLPLYKEIEMSKLKDHNLALAKLLGNIEGKKSRNLLIKLIENPNSVVQGEAIRQLSNEPPEIIGPILTSKLTIAKEGKTNSGNIMNPVINQSDGGKFEIIKTLGNIGYKPAIPKLLPYLKTTDNYLFKLIIKSLNKLGSKKYIPYLNMHLENKENDLIFDICRIITDNNLEECIPSLMNYISTHDKSTGNSKEYTISESFGLVHFNSDTVKDFLASDFLSVVKMERSGEIIDNKKDWGVKYLNTFAELRITKAKDLAYDYMYDYYGINSKFRDSAIYFKTKLEKEDSLKNLIKNHLQPLKEKIDFYCIAFIDSNLQLKDFQMEYEIIIPDYLRFNDKSNYVDSMSNIIKNNIKLDHFNVQSDFRRYLYNKSEEIYNINNSMMKTFLEYISSVPDKKDIIFLKRLKNSYPGSESYIDKYLKTAKLNLTSPN